MAFFWGVMECGQAKKIARQALRARMRDWSRKVMMIISGTKCCLVTPQKDDFEWFWYWQNNGEWRNSDAPWERGDANTKESAHERFLRRLDSQHRDGINRLWIQVGTLKIGSVSTYNDIQGDSVKLGIGIYEDGCQNRGIGTNALELWMYYLLVERGYHKLGLDTYRSNKRMQKVAEGVGFTLEGTEREIRKWGGEWVTRLNYGILDSEYEFKGRDLKIDGNVMPHSSFNPSLPSA